MKEIDNRGKVNRYKYLLYFYGLFIVFILVYKFIFLPELSNIILLAAVAPIFGFMSSIVNWPVYTQVVPADKNGILIITRRLFSKDKQSLLINKFNFDSYYETDHLHLGLNVLDEDDNLVKHKVKVSWLKLKDLRGFEEMLKDINPHAPTNKEED
jgi:hypothetical protein